MLQAPASPREELPALVANAPGHLEQFKNGLWRTFPGRGPAHSDSKDFEEQEDQEEQENTARTNGIAHLKRLHPARMASTMPLTKANGRALKPLQKTSLAPWAPYVTDINVFQCDHPNCNMSFGRMYLLRMHKRSHESAPNYYQYRSAPQLGLDPPQSVAEVAATTLSGSVDELFPAGFGSNLPEHLRADLDAIREQLRSRPGVP